jgi:hypothetical protein
VPQVCRDHEIPQPKGKTRAVRVMRGRSRAKAFPAQLHGDQCAGEAAMKRGRGARLTPQTPCKKCGAADRYGKQLRCRPCNYASSIWYVRKQRGWSETLRDSVFQEQEGKCAVCGNALRTAGRGSMATDHCHLTGKPRGLLCLRCNVALGHFKDDIAVLRKAIAYLERHQ